MSALPLKADMCSALAHVGFGPKADISSVSRSRLMSSFCARKNAAPTSRVCVTSLPCLALVFDIAVVGLLMPSSIGRHPTTEDDASEMQPKREFERWRVAVDIVRLLRQSGISCELVNIQNRH